MEQAVIRRFDAVVQHGPKQLFAYPTGESGLALLGYTPELLRSIPSTIREGFCGVGNVQKYVTLRPGDTVLDIGCGAGLDLFCAAIRVAPHGKALGVDCSPGMLRRLRAFTEPTGIASSGTSTDEPYSTPHLLEAWAHALPVASSTVDCVLSNGVFNMVRDKAHALTEVFRVLKPGGRFVLADQFSLHDSPASVSGNSPASLPGKLPDNTLRTPPGKPAPLTSAEGWAL